MRRYTRSLVGLALLVLAACSTPQVTIVSVEFTSHDDGDVVTGSRQVEVVAAVTAPSDATVVGEHDGQDLTFTRQGATLRANVTLHDGDNAIEVTVSAEGKSDTAALTLVYPFVRVEDGQPGAYVIGQESDTSASATAPSNMRILEPYNRPAYVGGLFFVPDSGTHRVLVFDGVPTSTGAPASFVVGQPSFDEFSPGTGLGAFNEPGAVVAHGDGLIVMDTQNSRILVFDELPTGFGAQADRVLGQPDEDSTDPGCSPTRFNHPDSAAFAGERFIVADTDNHRVLIWNQFPADADTPADVVLGQPDKGTCVDDELKPAGATASTLDTPQAVWSDGQRLIVADTGNFRVLIWDEVPSTDAAPADHVIGQPDFSSDDPAVDVNASTFAWPAYVDSNGNQIFVADEDNNRVLVWDEFPTTDGAPADHVLGQLDMSSWAPNRGQVTPGPETLNHPSGLHYLDGRLFVADYFNHRIVVFEAAAP